MANERGRPLRQIPGSAPSSLNRPAGCPFRPRCARATETCLTEPEETVSATGHLWRCFHPVEARA
jgi:peptide/nickel transport system ATP-binding protein